MPATASAWLAVHLAFGVACYGLFGIAVVHAWFMTRAEARIRHAQDPNSGLPLLTLERLTFRFVSAGFVLLSATLLVALTGLAGTGGWLLYRQHDRDVAAAAALDAARSYAVALTSTDQNSIDQNIKDLLDGATGNFKDTYGKTASRLRKMLIDNKVSTKGVVEDAAVKAVRGDDVDVLLSVKQDVTSAAVEKPRTDYVSVSMTMRKVGDKWLAAEVLLAGADGKRGK